MKKIFFSSLATIYLLLIIAIPVLADETLPSAITVDGQPANINQVIANMAKLVLGLVGVLALIMFIIGGITWMTSGGNAEQVKKGKGTLIWAAVGLVVCFMAYSLVTFVITKFIGISSVTTSTGGTTTPNPNQACTDAGGICIRGCSIANCSGTCKPGLCAPGQGGVYDSQCCVH